MKKTVLLITALFQFVITKAQVAYDTLSIGGSNWASTTIQDVLLDNQQHIWIAYKSVSNSSTSGIKKFDGTTWTQYQSSNSGLPSNFVYCIKQDAQNNYWIGTTAGLAKFDGTTWTVFNRVNSAIISDTVNDILIENQDILLATEKGVCKYNNSSWTNYPTISNKTYSLLKVNDTLYAGHKYSISVLNQNGTNQFTIANTMLNGNVNKIIYNPIYGIVLSCPTGIYQFKNNKFKNLEDVLKICTGSIRASSNNNYFKQIENNSNGNLLINCLAPLNPTHLKTFSEFSSTTYRTHTIQANNTTYNLPYITFQRGKIIFIQIVGVNVPNKVIIVDAGLLNTPFESNSFLDKGCNKSKLDVNQVNAGMLPLGDMFWDLNSNPRYEVPKNSGSQATSAGSIWIGGRVNNQLRTACQLYRQTGHDFWSGPLDTTNALSPTSNLFGNIHKVNQTDINEFIYHFNNGNVQNGTFIPSSGIKYWPAHDTGNFSRNTAPFVDVNQNGIYDPLTGGDYPKIKGDQMLYHIFNDAGGIHTHSNSPGMMGLEIHQSSFAYSCSNIADSLKALNYTTFYEFEIINRSDTLIDSTYIGFLNETDLGNYMDDYLGCNVKENYGYVYNGDNYDDDGSIVGYHEYLPCFSTAILTSPPAFQNDGKDNNHNGTIDETDEEVGMSSFLMFYNNSNATSGNPSSANQFFNYLKGKWRDGSTLKYGTNGFSGTQSTTFLFPGDSDPNGFGLGGSNNNPIPQSPWTEASGGNWAGDRRFLIGSGPFRIAPKDTAKIVYAMVFSVDSAVTGDINHNVIKSEQDVIRIRQWYKNNQFTTCTDNNTVNIATNKYANSFIKAYPNPTHDFFIIEKSIFEFAQLEIKDILGKTLLADEMRTTKHTIDVSTFAPGIYFIKVTTANQQQTIKVIKQ